MIDTRKLAHTYVLKLMRLQKRLFVYNEELDVLKFETIPALQYCCQQTYDSILKYYNAYIKIIDKDATYLNVGSGANLLEYVAKENNISVESADIKETNLIFDPIRNFIECPIDYTANMYCDTLLINTNKKYDYIMFNRYVPFEYDLDEQMFIDFILSTEQYADNIIISVIKGSYNDLREFFNGINDIIEVQDLQSTCIYTIRLKDFKERYDIN